MLRTAARTLRGLSIDPALAEDAVQDVWLRDPLRGFDPAKLPLLAWMRCCAKRAALDFARSLTGRDYARRPVAMDDIEPMVGARTTQQDARLELSHLFGGKCRLYLSQQDRVVISAFLRDESARETAARLGRCESYIHIVRDRAIRRVRLARRIRTHDERLRFARRAA